MHWITITCLTLSVLFMTGTFVVAAKWFFEVDVFKSQFYAFVWAAASAALGFICGPAIGAAANEELANAYSAAWCVCSLALLIGSIAHWVEVTSEARPSLPISSKDYSKEVTRSQVRTTTPRVRSLEIPTVTTLNFETSGYVPRLMPDQNSTLRARGMTKLYSNWKAVYFEMGSPYGQAVMTEVYLVTEKDNAYDSHAIAVAYGEVKLGYIPASYAPQLSHLITVAGGVVRAEAELWFDFRTREKRNSIRLLVKLPFVLDS